MDGGSAGETVEILRRHSDTVLWVSKKDNGQANALNKALSLAAGDIVGWLNADEYYEPQIFGRVTDAFQKNPDAVVVYDNFRRVTADGETIRTTASGVSILLSTKHKPPSSRIVPRFLGGIGRAHVGGFDASWHYLLDRELYVRLMRGNQKWVKLNDVLANFTIMPFRTDNCMLSICKWC